MAPSSQSNNQKSLAKTPKQCFSQATNCIRLVITPHIQITTCNRLLLLHLFPHNYNVFNMLHDALNRQKHLPLSTSFHASIMQHVHLQLHYIDTSILLKNVKRCRDGNVCEAYVIPFLFGSFFTVCHPYIDVHFLKCFFCYLSYEALSKSHGHHLKRPMDNT